MKGRTEFTKVEAERIRLALRELRATPPNRQKALRDRLRDTGFYISDWVATDECLCG